MAQSTFSLSWESHRNNICNGLSFLQQNGEFVDMTLAADGHHVKVHQIVMALASPYIKDLITSANCPHPVIYLNKISYVTLSAILEYIYTGEVIISVEHLPDLLSVATELHIKGLEEMRLQDSMTHFKQPTNSATVEENTDNVEDDIYFEVASQGTTPSHITSYTVDEGMTEDDKSMVESMEDHYDESVQEENVEPAEKKPRLIGTQSQEYVNLVDNDPSTILQYTISNQGSLQIVINRFVYYLKHVNRSGSRQWRCVDYLNARKCPAIVFTNNDVVLQRIAAHNHQFHDKRILAKVRAGAIFTALHDAESQGEMIKSKNKGNSIEKTEITA